MRESLFRGKRLDNGEWIYGDLLQIPNHHGKMECSIMEQKPVAGNYSVYLTTVGQYTGLTDKNGVKIFEGDIVCGLFLYSEPVKSVVSFQDGAFGLLWDRAGAETFWPFTSICNVKYEVIGNIHDDPEILEGGEGNG